MPSDPRTRLELQRIATHVLARRRQLVSGRFGLRATPGGIGTPAFGADVEVVRIGGGSLIHEVGGDASAVPLVGSTLASLAEAAGADLSVPFSAGDDTPPLGDVDATIDLDLVALERYSAFFDLGWRALDIVTVSADRPATLQLWPEHFDAGTSVAVGDGKDERCNLGASPGDDSHPEPYLYVGPWGSDRPGDPGYWNAPFGAVLAADGVGVDAAVAFYNRGIELLSGAPT